MNMTAGISSFRRQTLKLKTELRIKTKEDNRRFPLAKLKSTVQKKMSSHLPLKYKFSWMNER